MNSVDAIRPRRAHGAIRHTWDLVRVLTAREMKIRYKRSYFGVAWSLLNPLSQLLIFSFLFTTVVPLGIEHYTVFVFAGVLAWAWFSAALNGAVSAIRGNAELIRRPGFPVPILPVLPVVADGLHFLLAVPILIIFAIVDTGGVNIALLAFPLVVLVQFLFTLTLAYFVAACFVYFRDTQHLLSVLIMLGFYLTPVFYKPGNAPQHFSFIYDFNGMAVILGAYRDILIHHRWPDFASLGVVAAISLVTALMVYRFFARAVLFLVDDV